MKKIIRLVIFSTILMGLSGCAAGKKIDGFIDGLIPPVVVSKTDSVVIWTGDINNPKKVDGNAFIYFKNIKTNKEESIYMSSRTHNDHEFKVEPGTYKFTHWVFDTCKEGYRDGRCTKMHMLKGNSISLGSNGTFTIKKGEIIYLGNIVLNSAMNTISVDNHYSQDIKNLKSKYPTYKNRRIKNYNKKLNIKNWKFNITGKSFLGYL